MRGDGQEQQSAKPLIITGGKRGVFWACQGEGAQVLERLPGSMWICAELPATVTGGWRSVPYGVSAVIKQSTQTDRTRMESPERREETLTGIFKMTECAFSSGSGKHVGIQWM